MALSLAFLALTLMDSPETIISRTERFVREKLGIDATGHDWPHVERVRRQAIAIAREERANLEVVELAALLHDIADWKFHAGDEHAGPRVAREWLQSQGCEAELIERVCEIIAKLSFKGAGVAAETLSLEGKCVQDADRLEALGAIGIARAFAYGGSKGRAMYDPAIPPIAHATFAAYKSSTAPTLNHFYEKLLLLRDRMQTNTGRAMATPRHEFIEQFVTQFLREWHGE